MQFFGEDATIFLKLNFFCAHESMKKTPMWPSIKNPYRKLS